MAAQWDHFRYPHPSHSLSAAGNPVCLGMHDDREVSPLQWPLWLFVILWCLLSIVVQLKKNLAPMAPEPFKCQLLRRMVNPLPHPRV